MTIVHRIALVLFFLLQGCATLEHDPQLVCQRDFLETTYPEGSFARSFQARPQTDYALQETSCSFNTLLDRAMSAPFELVIDPLMPKEFRDPLTEELTSAFLMHPSWERKAVLELPKNLLRSNAPVILVATQCTAIDIDPNTIRPEFAVAFTCSLCQLQNAQQCNPSDLTLSFRPSGFLIPSKSSGINFASYESLRIPFIRTPEDPFRDDETFRLLFDRDDF